MNCVEKQLTYKKRLGYVLSDDEVERAVSDGLPPGVQINGNRWGSWNGVVLALPDVCDDKSDAVRPLPPGVAVAMTNYDGMVKL